MIWTTQPRSEGAGALSFFEAGEGPPLVLIHGVGLRAEAWLAMVPALSRQFRVICVDMPGHGASPLQHTQTLEDYCNRLTQFLAELPIPVFITGHSMGALLAVQLAARHPRKISGVAALNAIYRRDPEASKAVRARAEALVKDGAPEPEPTLTRWFGAAPEAANKAASEVCRYWLTEGDSKGYATAYQVFAEHYGPSDATLLGLKCAAAFVTGEDDPNSTPQMSRAMASLCSGGRVEVIAGAAHMMPMTHADTVAGILLDTFSKCKPGGAPVASHS